MNAAGPSWQLIRKERYDKIKDVLIRIRTERQFRMLGEITLSATNGLHSTHW